MIFRFNRFAIFPVMCNCCKRYIWLAPYRRADAYHHIPGEYLKERICKQCIPRYLPYVNEKGE
jgi:hypothetical protein